MKFRGSIGEYFKNLYSTMLKNLKEMDKFLDVYDQPKLTQMDINHLHTSIMSNGIEAVVVYQERRTQDWIDPLLSST
jgi:hypothetical protein